MVELRTIDELDVDGQRVLLRLDLDAPLAKTPANGLTRVADISRIAAALPTLQELRRRGGRIVLVSHLGSPQGFDPGLSMRPVAARLASLIGSPVSLAPAVAGPYVRVLTEELLPGEMLMLENVRFEPGERRNDQEFARALAELADVYVNDDFANTRRASASTEGVAHLLPSAAGAAVWREIGALDAIVDRPQRPLVAILGGGQLREKIALVRAFLELADVVCLGGAISLPFMAAQGNAVGAARCSSEDVESARLALAAAAVSGCRLELPRDLVRAARRDADSGAQTVAVRRAGPADDHSALDIGPRSAERFAAEVGAGASVFWNGPMGRFELPRFAAGTQRVAEAVAATAAMTVVAGVATIRSLQSLGLRDHVTHISTGGETALEFLEGRELPGIRVLLRTPVATR